LRPGDGVRFTIRAREPVFVAVIGLDASGRSSVYHPEGGELTRVEAGSHPLPAAIELDGTPRAERRPAAIELDGTPGDERVYAVFCGSAVAIAHVTEAIERSPDAPALPPGCSSERHTLRREAP
jgi:hypothetical protein